MSVEEVEQAVSGFTPEELSSVRKSFADYDMAQRDKQIEANSKTSRLDSIINQALEKMDNGYLFHEERQTLCES